MIIWKNCAIAEKKRRKIIREKVKPLALLERKFAVKCCFFLFKLSMKQKLHSNLLIKAAKKDCVI